MKTPDYGKFMDVQQDINLRLLEALEREGIKFAFPTQRLWLEGESRVRSQLISSASAEASAAKG